VREKKKERERGETQVRRAGRERRERRGERARKGLRQRRAANEWMGKRHRASTYPRRVSDFYLFRLDEPKAVLEVQF
jgi:hypothetical protein